MEIFNVKRRDVYDFDQYMDLKKPGFGGPKSAMMYKDGRGKLVNQKPKLKEYQRQVERHPQFGHQVYNPTYKAMTHDLVYKQSGKKPYNYRDPYLTAIPTIDMKRLEESLAKSKFGRFLAENHHMDEMGYESPQITIRLVSGFIPDYMKTRLERLYPGATIKLVGDSMEEVIDAIEFYGLENCTEISAEEMMRDTREGVICDAKEVLNSMINLEMGEEEYLDNF